MTTTPKPVIHGFKSLPFGLLAVIQGYLTAIAAAFVVVYSAMTLGGPGKGGRLPDPGPGVGLKVSPRRVVHAAGRIRVHEHRPAKESR